MKILVVDEEPQTRKPIAERLTRDGHAVVVAADDDDATALLERESPDVVLLGLRSPGTDKLEVLKTIHERLPDVPVIVTAVSTADDKAVEAIKLGAFDAVAQSNTDELALTVKRAAETAQLRRVVGLHVREH